ncbi:MAG: ROK family protein [Thermotogae bacterium]|nr:ROK family protein [Thermotogota bacterium]
MKYSVGVDLGGTNIVAGLVNEDGKILRKSRLKTQVTEGFDRVVFRMAIAVKEVLEDVDLKNIVGVGVGSPGSIEPEEGIVYVSPNFPGWINAPLGRTLSNKLNGIKVKIGNDANVITLAEYWKGAGKGKDNIVCLTLGTGIGSGVILDGKLYTGTNGLAPELGHMSITEGGPVCGCGQHGCLETLASATAIVKRTKELLSTSHSNFQSNLREQHRTLPKNIEAKDVFKADREGNSIAKQVIDEAIKYLAIGIKNIINIFNPQVVILTGGMANAGDRLFVPLRQEVRKRVIASFMDTYEILPGELGDNAGILGGAYLVKS